MRRAITLGRKGLGRTAPNPAVGCVIAKDGNLVGQGWHQQAGSPHAEIHALNMAGTLAKGADVYVTLEPCNHLGKTPPCTEALIAAQVRRVVVGLPDPFMGRAGMGMERLRQAGILVETSPMHIIHEQCKELVKGFHKVMTTGLPWLIYKSAITLDGRIATQSGHSQWISGEVSRRTAHRLRATSDAIMVGVDTVLADNPSLTVRHVKGRNPVRVVVDSSLRTPLDCKLINSLDQAGTIIATCVKDKEQQLPFIQQQAEILLCSDRSGRVDLREMLQKLAERGLHTILLEGGSKLAGELLQQGLIDECIFFCGPKLVGNGPGPFRIDGIENMSDAIGFEITKIAMSGPDIMIHARPEQLCSPA